MAKKLIGPIRYFKNKCGVSVFLKGHENSPFGWELGQDEGAPKFHIKLVIGPITFIDIERHSSGWCFNVLGFWWIP